MQTFFRLYGTETIIHFVLYEVDGVNFKVDALDAGADCTIMKDEGAEATCTNDFVDEGMGYSLALTATEMQAKEIMVYVVDSATKVWLDEAIKIETYGHVSALHPSITEARLAELDAANMPADIDVGLAQIGALENLSQAEAQTAAAAALTAYDPPTKAEMDAAHALLATEASLATLAGYLDTEIAAILDDTGTTIPALIAALNNLSAAQVNAEVVDALNVDTYSEPGQGLPSATPTIRLMLHYLFKQWRNKHDGDGTTEQLYNDAGTTVDQKRTVSEAAGIVTKAGVVAGP